LYIFNTLILPISPKYRKATVTLERVTVEEVKKMIQDFAFTSAVGHQGTAELLSNLLGVPIPANRIAVHLEKGDVGIHFALRTRLPEGKVLSKEELEKLEYEFIISRVVDAVPY